MSITFKARYIRIAPRKVRLVADMIRGEKADKAKSILQFTVNRSALPIAKLLKSAVTSAEKDKGWSSENLKIEKITVDEGPKLKRWMPRARGSASPIQKKTSHITITLNEIEKTFSVNGKKKKNVSATKVSSLDEIKDFNNKKKTERAEKAERVKSSSDQKVKAKHFRRKSI
jgi:large subunit ribosomal protein L22